MNNNPIFYVINGQFYENSDSNSKKLKKITFIFENEKPKELRESALNKFTEIRNSFLIKNNADAPTYHVVNNIGKRTCVDAIENVPFYTQQSKLNLALTLSFGIKDSSRNYNSIDSDKYPYNKNLHPIAAIGKSLHEVEESLKINLILEKQFYETYNEETPEINSIKNFVNVSFLKDYILFNCNHKSNNLQKTDLLTKVLQNKYFDIFPTSQFYSYEKVESLCPIRANFLGYFDRHFKVKQRKREVVYKRELENMSEFYCLLNGLEAGSIDLSKLSLSRKLKGFYLKPFFTKKQYRIYEKIVKLENKFLKGSDNEQQNMHALIRKWL